MTTLWMGFLTWHSTKCPIRALAMTGMVTASMISLIMLGSDMRATPPWALMSAGTRSRAMTAEAPASSAIRAYTLGLDCAMDRYPWERLTCSALTTSMITPPFNIWARPALTVKVLEAAPFEAPFC